MDAAARRELWNTIADAKPGRTFLLTTHYMDEADILGDAIAIMARGVVKCVGSSLFLKKRFGGGLRLCCEREAGAGPAALAAFDTFLFEHMGFNGKRERTGAEARLAERQIVATLDAGAADRLPALFRALDDGALAELRIASYGVGPSTLEAVFLKVGEGGDDDDEVVEADPHDAAAGPAPAAAKPPVRPTLEWGALETDDRRQVLALWRKQLTIVARDPYEVVVAAVPTYAPRPGNAPHDTSPAPFIGTRRSSRSRSTPWAPSATTGRAATSASCSCAPAAGSCTRPRAARAWSASASSNCGRC
jgi:hypothetical protein